MQTGRIDPEKEGALSAMNSKAVKRFFKPDLRKFSLFFAIPVGLIAILFLLGPLISSVSYTPTGLIVGTVSGTMILIVVFPFGLVASAFRAFGIDFFYTEGVVADLGIASGILATVIWWYVLSGTIVTVWDKLRTNRTY